VLEWLKKLPRLLDPSNPSVTLLTIERAARALGKKARVEPGARHRLPRHRGSPNPAGRLYAAVGPHGRGYPHPAQAMENGRFSRQGKKHVWNAVARDSAQR